MKVRFAKWAADIALDIIIVSVPIAIAVAGFVVVAVFDVTPAGALYPVIVAGVGAFMTYLALNELRKHRRRQQGVATPDYAATYEAVRSTTLAAGDAGSVDTAVLVLEEARTAYERAFSGSESVEAKASALLSIVAGGSSVIGVFGFGKEGHAVTVTHIVIAAVACIIAALALLFYILRAKHLPQPSVAEYVIPAMAREDNRIGIALRLAVTYNDAAYRIAAATAREPAALLAAATLTASAAVLVLVNAAFPCPQTPTGSLMHVCPAGAGSPTSTPAVPSAIGGP